MLVLGVTDTLKMKWCQITTGGRKYTCPTKEIMANCFFALKRYGTLQRNSSQIVQRFYSQKAEEYFQDHLKNNTSGTGLV